MEYYEKADHRQEKDASKIYILDSINSIFHRKAKDRIIQMLVTKRRSLKIGKSFYLPIGITMQITERYQAKEENLDKKRSTVKIKKTAGTIIL